MNYEELYKKTQQDLDAAKIKRAKLQERIKDLVAELGLTLDSSLPVKLKSLKESLLDEKSKVEEKLRELEQRARELNV